MKMIFHTVGKKKNDDPRNGRIGRKEEGNEIRGKVQTRNCQRNLRSEVVYVPRERRRKRRKETNWNDEAKHKEVTGMDSEEADFWTLFHFEWNFRRRKTFRRLADWEIVWPPVQILTKLFRELTISAVGFPALFDGFAVAIDGHVAGTDVF